MIVLENLLGEATPENTVMINEHYIESLTYVEKSNGIVGLLDKEYTCITMRSGRQFRIELPLMDVVELIRGVASDSATIPGQYRDAAPHA